MADVFTSDSLHLVGLDHYAINVADLRRSSDWYSKVLGFQILHKWDTTWMVGQGNIKVGLFLRPSAKPIDNTDAVIAITHIAFLVDGDKFQNAVRLISSLGVTVEGPEDSGIAYSIFVTDPDGHRLEITTYHS
jgi:catechol 2,3-dioxygenase-like lactoylglutathione lyase family enzyme